MSYAPLLSEIEASRKELAKVCSELIKHPTDHPEGRTVECIEYIKGYFERLGVHTEVHARDKNKPNILARIEGSSERRMIWLGHLDEVPVGDLKTWTYPPFGGEIADGKVWGRGASDMKGSCASAMVAAKHLINVKPPIGVDFWFTADEEVGAIEGASWLAQEKLFEGEVAIVGDSSGCTPGLVNIGLGNKGGIGTSLVAKGKTAHSSTPYLGDNAIDKLLKVVPYVKKISEHKLELPDDIIPLLESTTEFMLKDPNLDDEQRKAVRKLFYYPTGPSLNLFNGGIKSNVVPDSATCYFDIRLTPGCNALKVKDRLEELVAEANVPGVTANIRVRPQVGYYELPDSPAVISLSKAIEVAIGEKPVLTVAPWGTDALHLKRQFETTENSRGIPVLLFGPMHRDQLHQPNEYVSIDNLTRACKVYAIYPFFYGKAS